LAAVARTSRLSLSLLSYDAQFVVTPTASGITTLEQLAGGRIGVSAGTTSETRLREKLSAAGINAEVVALDNFPTLFQQYINIELGFKGKKGILAFMKNCRAFLSDSNNRICFVYLPKHTSCLNQIEYCFSILIRRPLKRG
jgi:hypothetical protein